MVERMQRWAVVQIVAGVMFLVLALILREIILGITRTTFGHHELPTIWFSPKGWISYGWSGVVYGVWAAFVMIALGYAAYRSYVRLFERRVPVEIEREGAARELGIGVAIGVAFVGIITVLLWLLGDFEASPGPSAWLPLAAAASAATAAFMEELAARGIIFRIVESRLGSWLALGLSAAVFGVMHATNPGATLWSTAAVALSAGVVLGAAFIATRRLWLAVGIHFGVNLTQGAILGLPVSGQPTFGVLSSHLRGSAFLTGGDFGMEASVLIPILSLVVSAALLVYASYKGRIQPSIWSKKMTLGF
jgi:membrane protease YdiL (CAAX protease family)